MISGLRLSLALDHIYCAGKSSKLRRYGYYGRHIITKKELCLEPSSWEDCEDIKRQELFTLAYRQGVFLFAFNPVSRTMVIYYQIVNACCSIKAKDGMKSLKPSSWGTVILEKNRSPALASNL